MKNPAGQQRSPGKGWKRPDDQKRHAIMQAAERLFTSRRFHEITMDDVAAAAGVAKGTLYYHFRHKDDLFFQTCMAGFDQLCDLLEQKVQGRVRFHQQFLNACHKITVFFDQRHQLLRMMQTEDERMPYCRGVLRDRWMLKRKRLVAAIAHVLCRGVAAGAIRDDLPPEVLANVLLGMLRTRSRGLANAPARVRSHEVIVDLFCNGAGRRPTSRQAKPLGSRRFVAKRRTLRR